MPTHYVEGMNPEPLPPTEDPDGFQPEDSEDGPRYGDPIEDGPLLTLPPEKAAKHALKLWKAQDDLMAKRKTQWKANHLMRRGVPGVQIVKKQDTHQWTVWLPPNAAPDSVPAINKAATICRRLRSIMFADPPAPDPTPPSTDDEDVEAAEFSERVLLDVQGESGLRDVRQAERAFDRASTYGSGFVRYYVDPHGGGRSAVQVMAGYDPLTGQRATSVKDLEQRPVMEAVPELDPMTGTVSTAMQPVVDPFTGEPRMEDWPEYEERFVMPDGTLTDEEGQAAQRWLPGLKSEVLTGRNVRFLPHTATDIWDADGVMVQCFIPWSEAKKLLEGEEVSDETKKHIFGFRPEHPEDLLPPGDKNRLEQKDKDHQDDTLVLVQTTYYKQCGSYPRGAYVITIADKLAPTQDPWVAEIDGREEPLDIPITQYKQGEEGEEDPYTKAMMQVVGPGNNARADMLGALIDHLDRLNHRLTFLPTNSVINPKDLQLRTRAVVPMNPGGQPVYEDIPPFPKDALELFAIMGEEQDAASGLNQTAQGLEDPSVESGRHALAIMSQAHAALSELKHNIEQGYLRGCRIQLQLIRGFYDVPRQLRWQGADGEFRHRSWMGADLRNTTDVRLKSGTLSMLTPAAKVTLAERYLQMQVIDLDQFKDILANQVGGEVGLEDDPFRLRIKRQISEWKEGPPEDWQPPEPVPQMTELGPQLVAPPDPVLAAIWEPRAADTLPQIAQMRMMELARLTASKAYDRHPPPWRQAVDMEFQRMAMVVQMAQMQAQPQPDAEEEGEDTSAEAGDRNEAARAQEIAVGG